MDVENIDMTEEAKKAYNEYSELVKKREEEYLRVMKSCTYHLSQGRKVLNIFDAIVGGGVNEQGEPKLAVARADWGNVVFSKHRGRTGVFCDSSVSETWGHKKEQVMLPINFFEKEWEVSEDDKKRGWFTPTRRTIQTPVPIIPHQLLPDGSLSKYYILFEVDGWVERQERGRNGSDPILLKRLSNNMFAVLDSWDVSPLEKAVLDGLGRIR